MRKLYIVALIYSAVMMFTWAYAAEKNDPKPITDSMATAGMQVFHSVGCSDCHGGHAQGNIGPKLAGLSVSEAQFEQIIRTGKGMVSSYSPSQISDEQIAEVYAYLQSLKHPTTVGNKSNKGPAAVVGSLWKAPADGAQSVSLIILNQPKPVVVAIKDSTVLGGTYLQGGKELRFKPADAGKICKECSSDDTMAACVAGTNLKHSTWQEMLDMLPLGTGLRIAYNKAGDPNSGLKSLIVDRRMAILPIKSSADLSAGQADHIRAQLLKLAKPLGGTSVELGDGGRQCIISLKSDWTNEKEAELARALDNLGLHIAFKTGEVASK